MEKTKKIERNIGQQNVLAINHIPKNTGRFSFCMKCVNRLGFADSSIA